MFWHGGTGPAWWWGMGVGMVALWLLLLVTVAVVVRWGVHASTGERGASAERSTARAILDERFARGEIDEETYRRMSGALRGR